MTIAIEAIGLTKDFEKGRRTIWQRLRREPDRGRRFARSMARRQLLRRRR